MLTPDKSIPKRKPKKNVMDYKIQNLRRLHRTSKNKRKIRELMRKENYEFLIFFRIQLCSAYEHEGKCTKDLSKGLMTHSFNSAAYHAEISHKHGKVWEQIWKFRTSMFEHSHIWWQVGKALLDLSIVSCAFDTGFLFGTKLWLIVKELRAMVGVNHQTLESNENIIFELGFRLDLCMYQLLPGRVV